MLTLRPAIVKPNLWDFCAFDPMLFFTRSTTAGHMAPLCEKNAQTEKNWHICKMMQHFPRLMHYNY